MKLENAKTLPNYLKPTVSSKAKRHPRALKSFEAEKETVYQSAKWKPDLKKPRHRCSASEVPSTSYMKETFCSKMKRKEKVSRAITPEPTGRASVQRERRPKKRSQSVMSITSIGDSALGDLPEKQILAKNEISTPSPPPSVAGNNQPPVDKAAFVLAVLYRMNRPKAKVNDMFDIIVSANANKHKDSRRRKPASSYLSRKFPRAHALVEYCQNLTYSSVQRISRSRSFVIVFPLLLLHMASQFPSILTAVLSVTHMCWRKPCASYDLYFLNSLMGCLFRTPSA